MPDALLPADDGRDRNHMVRIGRVPDAQQKPHAKDCEKVDHRKFSSASGIRAPPALTIKKQTTDRASVPRLRLHQPVCQVREPFSPAAFLVYHGRGRAGKIPRAKFDSTGVSWL